MLTTGMVLVAPELNPKACWEFDGEILVLHHPTTISVKYQAMGTLSVDYIYPFLQYTADQSGKRQPSSACHRNAFEQVTRLAVDSDLSNIPSELID